MEYSYAGYHNKKDVMKQSQPVHLHRLTAYLIINIQRNTYYSYLISFWRSVER